MKRIEQALLILLTLSLASCSSKKLQVVTTTADKGWSSQEVEIKKASAKPQIVINSSKTLHKMEGFGACFNELGWVALSHLTGEERKLIMSEFFEPGKGGNLTVCRMPLGANDFSRDWYSYNEQEGDFEMANFSIENDQSTLIPYIKSVQSIYPDLKIWASPWSPPSWMKWNKHYACALPNENLAKKYHNGLLADRQGKEGSNMFIQESEYFEAYAQYFALFVEAYSKEGIDIAMVMPQNEWNSCQIFPSCTWTAAGLAEFIGKHLGPKMKQNNVELMLGTMERPSVEMVDTILNDPAASKYISGVGFQWAGKKAIPKVHKKYPKMKLYQTEQECGDGKNDWKHCVYSWDLMRHYISNGASTYLYWNMALESGGVSRWGWSQNSFVTVDPETKSYSYNHEYYLMKHVSHFVQSGAYLLETSGEFENLLAFKNPDNSVVVILRNETKAPKEFSLSIDGESFAFSVTGDSFSTVVLN